MEEKRRFARAPFDGSASLAISDDDNSASLDVILADLSLRGALLELSPDTQLVAEQTGVLTLQLEDSDIAISLKCKVSHSAGGRAGVEFMLIDVEAMQHLRRLVELNLGESEEHELGFLASPQRNT
ncbi:MAG: PilZ domain-containing protein [Alcanivoracaceae bacterium]|nr:PilZ domain-containing protein [Alcanivoracaceae bacterium]